VFMLFHVGVSCEYYVFIFFNLFQNSSNMNLKLKYIVIV
jgi:hypothetical protein